MNRGMWRCTCHSLSGTNRVHLSQIYRRLSIIRKGATSTPGRTVLSGIQPTGVPHLGNYFGALQQWVRLQNEKQESDQLFFPIVDLHALTVAQDPSQFATQRHEAYVSLRAVGLDPKKSHIFFQSKVRPSSPGRCLLTVIGTRACGANVDSEHCSLNRLSLSDDAVEGKISNYCLT